MTRIIKYIIKNLKLSKKRLKHFKIIRNDQKLEKIQRHTLSSDKLVNLPMKSGNSANLFSQI